MFFQKNPGWGIVFRVFVVLLLIGGVFALTRFAFVKGYSVGLGTSGSEFSELYDFNGSMRFHDQSFMPHQGFMPQKGYLPQQGFMPHMGMSGGMYYPSQGGFGGSVLHFLFGILGLILLVKLVMWITGMGMYGSRRHYFHRGHHMGHPYYGGHHRCQCECCSEDQLDEEPEEAPKAKTTKKKK
ncbi:MAG: hypothetical protein HQ574_02600 [Chloroflexi bacterium]|nr:hypothetical protein [Chloroflexota bacterium]